MPEIVLAILVVFTAMFVRGFTGFGAALLAVPLLALFWDVQLAIVVVAVLQVVAGGMLTYVSRRSIERYRLYRLLAGSLVGLLIGAILLSSLSVEWITRILGVFTVVVGLQMIVQRGRVLAEPVRSSRVVNAVVGVVGGILQGMIGTAGPIIVPYLQRQLRHASALRATLLAYFFALDAIRLVGYVPLGIAGVDAIAPSLILLPVALVASLLGMRVQLEVSETVFRIGVGLVLLVSGLLLLI